MVIRTKPTPPDDDVGGGPLPPPPLSPETEAITKVESKQKRLLQTIIFPVILFGVFVLIWITTEAEQLQQQTPTGDVDIRLVAKTGGGDGGGGGTGIKGFWGSSSNNKGSTPEQCTSLCTESQVEPSIVTALIERNRYKKSRKTNNKENIYDILDRSKLLDRVNKQKTRLIEQLRDDYGPIYFQKMFVDSETNKYRPVIPITPDGPSLERFKRKLLMKVLSVQSKLLKQQAVKCDCNTDYEDDTKTDNDNDMLVFERFVHATGGHSSSAGHGNLFNESYTAIMTNDLQPIFESIGIDFEGRNFAMGGTSSAGGVSMCWKQIFGDDVDLFSWDYGMTDGNYAERLLHYGYRGGLSSSVHFPALIGVMVGGRARRWREGALQKLESLGMATFYGSDDNYKLINDAIPDTSGMSTEEIAALPEYVRNLKCGGAIEKGEPFCGKEKFTTYICKIRGKQTSWHPGWKEHAKIGHGLSLFIMQTMIEALTDLNEHETTDVDELLSQLRQEEDELFANFTAAELPDDHKKLFKVGEDLDPNFDPALFWKGPSLCHTSLTPSISRYYGYLTNTDKVGGFAIVGNETYDVGTYDVIARREPSNGVMRLVWEQGERERDCPIILKPDYKDIFYTGSTDGWTKLTFPNDAEKKAYNYQPSDFKGIIVIYLIGCPFGKCPSGHLAIDQYKEKKWEMKINGKPIVSLSDAGFDAIIPKSEDGIYFEPKEDGTYDIEIKVNEEKSFVKVTAFVLY